MPAKAASPINDVTYLDAVGQALMAEMEARAICDALRAQRRAPGAV
jgi:hypothetical protein